jgi:hypothetical protein
VRITALAAAVIGLALAASAPAAARTQTRVNPDAKLMADFEARVKDYSILQHNLEETLPALPKDATADQTSQHQAALARLVVAARTHAKQGDIFTRETRALFRRFLSRVLTGPEGANTKALIMDDNPSALKLSVNSRYPDSIPVTTVPPQVIQALPKLPPGLEYRFTGNRLVLLDTHAHVVVDLIEQAIR